MTVNCWNEDCINYESDKCKLSEITIWTDGCEDYLSYSDSKEYQTEYWKAVTTIDNKTIGRASARGKLIKINGMDFFTEIDSRLPENQIYVTNAKTGILTGNVLYVKNNWEKLLERIELLPDVIKRPICVYDRYVGGYVITEEEKQ